MSQTFVFGYGSLVNGATHSHAPLYPARLIGWRRAWAKRYTARAGNDIGAAQLFGAPQ